MPDHEIEVPLQDFVKTVTNQVLSTLNTWVAVALVVFFIISWVDRNWLYSPEDTTDSMTKHSGMGLHQDALTGCFYLSTRGGGLTPRLKVDGTHMCPGGSNE